MKLSYTKTIYGSDQFNDQQDEFIKLIKSISQKAKLDKNYHYVWQHGVDLSSDEFTIYSMELQYCLKICKSMSQEEFDEFNLNKEECIKAFQTFIKESKLKDGEINFTWH